MKVSSSLCWIGLMAFLASACQSHYYKEAQNIPNAAWDKNNVISLQANIDDASATYDVLLDFSYYANITHLALEAQVEITSPSGETETKAMNIPIKTESGEQLGDVAGDYGDISAKIKENSNFSETGVYTFKISQAMPPQTVGGISRVGIIIDKVE